MLNNAFIELTDSSTVNWLNSPPHWEIDALLATFIGDIVISTDVIFLLQQDYDQAGLMISLSDRKWKKVTANSQDHAIFANATQ
ncbi:hypothetical protein FE394_13985 [Xenorhabdus sp. Reich]|uniref:Uncharacterized protein n=1 Tax=Xenorhabdus littoralis TaxID=2582835 RepID=A0ABU4SP11_9GAMM|nr:hypothetical protein [Xenorhabdus sp. Reich]MDX8000275.1 hypothetical protein [Xenorhabdus sp. Reich]